MESYTKYGRGGFIFLLIEIFDGFKIYSRFFIDFNNKNLNIIENPNRNIRIIDDIFKYPEKGFCFNYETVLIFLKNRGISSETKSGVYENVDDNIKIVVIK